MWHPHQPIAASTRRGLGIAAVVLLLAGWSAVAASGWVGPAKLPTPWAVAAAFGRLIWDPDLGRSPIVEAISWSGARIALASLLMVAVGVPLGVLMGASPKVDAFLSPLVDPLRAAPIVAVQPILLAWLGIGETMKIAFLWLGAVVYLVPMVRDAIRAVPQQFIVLSQDLGASPFETIRHTIFPLAMPRIFDGIIVSIGIQWTYITVAEYLNADAGIGYVIQNARKLSQMDMVFAGILVVMGLALATDQALRATKRWLYPWETEG